MYRESTRSRIGLTGAIITFALVCPVWGQSNGVQINTDELGRNVADDAANEPSFAVGLIDPSALVVGWRQFPTITSDNRFAGFAFSSDSGRTWTNGGQLDPPPGAGANANQSDPVIAIDANGAFFYNSLIFRSQRDGLVTYRSETNGSTWEIPFYVTEPFEDKNWYVVDTVGAFDTFHHYCCWTGGFSRSIDDGESWTEYNTVRVGTLSYLHVGPDSELYIGSWPGSAVEISRSDNARDPAQSPTFPTDTDIPFGSASFGLPVNPAGAASQVYIETDHGNGPRRGEVHVLSSAVRQDDVCDVMYARSSDRGQTFTDPVRINDDAGNQDFQWMAAMSMSPGGRLDAVWFDTRDDSNHRLSRLYYAYSYDQGRTWSANRALSEQFDSTLGWPRQNKIGDYFQCQSSNGSVAVVYPATFNGEQDLYFLRAYPMLLEATPFNAGEDVTFSVSGAKPSANTWLVASLAGEGDTKVPPLDIRLGILEPQQVGSPRATNANGDVSWTFKIPGIGVGRTAWVQAAQFQNTSNVVSDVIR